MQYLFFDGCSRHGDIYGGNFRCNSDASQFVLPTSDVDSCDRCPVLPVSTLDPCGILDTQSDNALLEMELLESEPSDTSDTPDIIVDETSDIDDTPTDASLPRSIPDISEFVEDLNRLSLLHPQIGASIISSSGSLAWYCRHLENLQSTLRSCNDKRTILADAMVLYYKYGYNPKTCLYERINLSSADIEESFSERYDYPSPGTAEVEIPVQIIQHFQSQIDDLYLTLYWWMVLSRLYPGIQMYSLQNLRHSFSSHDLQLVRYSLQLRYLAFIHWWIYQLQLFEQSEQSEPLELVGQYVRQTSSSGAIHIPPLVTATGPTYSLVTSSYTFHELSRKFIHWIRQFNKLGVALWRFANGWLHPTLNFKVRKKERLDDYVLYSPPIIYQREEIPAEPPPILTGRYFLSAYHLVPPPGIFWLTARHHI